MLQEGRLKNVALLVALDIRLKCMIKSPERCARNLVELGLTAYPNKISKKYQGDLYQKFLTACKQGDAAFTKNLFFAEFL